ncbi:L-type lectin-domain containing receptor kinase IX.2 [Brachypodium distachyon]|nr:L-type lectin-domain containing receptor kinase IX.2 [Brachypodium distachyon]|eukprot:XP_003577940.1 L-type lectin-domain containing receptor kinase IX.2 [Brachypodium distachyon]
MFAASRSLQLLLQLNAGCFLLSILPFDVAAAAAAAPPFSFSFDFSNSSTYNLQDLHFEGNATHDLHGKLIDLTCNSIDSIRNCTGRISYADPVPFYDDAKGIVASFATRFTFRVSWLPGQESRKGDGMAFFLTGYPSDMPPDSEGGGLGLMNSDNSIAVGNHRFVAVEFDTHNNSYEHPAPKSLDHIAINLNSVRNSFKMTHLPSFSIQGTMTASINFDGNTRRLVATLQFDDRPFTPPVEVSAQLPEPITALLPPEVAVGFSASTGQLVELHQILSWSFNSTLAQETERYLLGLIIAAIVGGFLVFIVVIWFILAWFMRKRGRDSIMAGTGQRRFRYRDLVNATDNFSEKRKLGKGAFGAVYQGTSLKGHGGQVAVKKIFKGSLGGPKNFLDEINTISKTKHKNLVSLEGWCCSSSGSWNLMCCCCQKEDDHNIFLVYELMPQGNLHDHLHKEDTVLPWPTRYKIVKGIGSALLYLHHECHPYILHRDIKPGNILLDNDYNAKLADFGLSRIADHNNATVVTNAVGTRGYMDPQCMKAGKVRFNRSTDLYSFGIVLLEIACQRNKSRDGVWDLYSNNDAERMVEVAADERLGGNFDRAQMHRVLVLGLWCSLRDGAQRPSMQDAMQLLEHDNTPLPHLASSATGSSI